MGKYRVIIKPKAEQDLIKIKMSGNVASIKRIERIILELSENPYLGTGKPEQLKHQLSGFWSRRVNKKDRLIYQIFETPDQKVVIISALGHY